MQGFRLQHAHGRSSRTRGCAKRSDYLFDFEWTNKNLFYGAYTRTESYFSNSELASSGLPSAGRAEAPRAAQGPRFRDDGLHQAVRAAEDRRQRQYPRQSARGAAACWKRRAGRSRTASWSTTRASPSPSNSCCVQAEFERIVLPFAQNLRAHRHRDERAHRRPGAIREPACSNFDFDMTVVGIRRIAVARQRAARLLDFGAPPTSRAATMSCGVKSKAVDELVDLVIARPDRQALVDARARARPRAAAAATTSSRTGISTYFRVAYWDKFGRPKIIAALRAGARHLVDRPGARQDVAGEEAAGRAETLQLADAACSPTRCAASC